MATPDNPAGGSPEPPSARGEAMPEPSVAGGDVPEPANGMSDTVARLTDHDLDSGERRRLMGRLVAQTAGRTTRGGWLPRPGAIMGGVIEALSEIAQRLPLRDLATLRSHFPGMTDEELATRLIRNASRATAAVGAAGGGVAAVEWAVPPTLLTAPVLLTAETIAVAAVELKLIGELHEVYGQPIRGTVTERATALLTSWASRRGINPLTSGRGMGAVLSSAARKQLRDRLLRRFGRNLTTLGPLLTGAAVGAELNRRATKSVGEEVREDLRGSRPHRVIEGTVAPRPVEPG